MAITASWVPRHRQLQGDVLVDHFAAAAAAPDGWEVKLEWRFRASSGDAWSAPTTQTVAPPTLTADYTPPGDGFVQLTCYSARDGLASWQVGIFEFAVAGGVPLLPGTRITDSGDRRITDNDDIRVTG